MHVRTPEVYGMAMEDGQFSRSDGGIASHLHIFAPMPFLRNGDTHQIERAPPIGEARTLHQERIS